MKRNRRALAVAIGVWITVWAIAPKSPSIGGPVLEAAPALTDLKSVDELRTLFNHDRGKPRLVLLLSPT